MSSITIPSITLANIHLASEQLASVGTLAVRKKNKPQYQRILDKMPQELREALLVWYCPKLQGLTNEELADNSGYYKGGLHDLSGNGYDADIYGMSGQIGDGYVNDNGELVFDGVTDYINAINIPACKNGYNVFVLVNSTKLLVPIAWEDYAVITTPNELKIYVINGGVQTDINVKKLSLYRLFEFRNDTINAETLFNSVMLIENQNQLTPVKQPLRLMGRPVQSRYSQGVMNTCLIFNKVLTDNERAWLQSNMINL